MQLRDGLGRLTSEAATVPSSLALGWRTMGRTRSAPCTGRRAPAVIAARAFQVRPNYLESAELARYPISRLRPPGGYFRPSG
jgi:hypothetical protein